MFKTGTPIIYRKDKCSTRPGRRARAVAPTRGDTYNYYVNKFWLVERRLDDGTLLVRTRTGKQHIVRANNPSLRRARFWERVLFRNRFPRLNDSKLVTS